MTDGMQVEVKGQTNNLQVNFQPAVNIQGVSL